jgi:peptidoglycan/xylan/chitin deacetylase (PgdA/CDA1 family)
MSNFLEAQLMAGIERFWGGDRITVLAYHRISQPENFRFFEPVISATPEGFARQMDIVATRFNPISVHDLTAWLDGRFDLPKRPILITFDDGYKDNMSNALPVLCEREIPALLFLSTDFIGTGKPFFWDAAAFYFRRTELRRADLPILGPVSWTEPATISAEWIEALKRTTSVGRDEATEQLAAALNVPVLRDAYAGETLSWDEVREMGKQGFSFGSHTLSHPILTQLSEAEAAAELQKSRQRLMDELGEPVRTIAYPNGTRADFNPTVERLTKAAGYSAAFTLVPGPARPREVRANPMTIRRISLYLDDGERRFRAKLAGAGRIKSSLS